MTNREIRKQLIPLGLEPATSDDPDWERRAKIALLATTAAAIALVAVCLALALLDGRNLIKAQFGVGQKEADKTRALIRQEVQTTRNELLARADALGPQVRAEERRIVKILDARLASIQTTANTRIADIADKADKQLTQANQTIVNMRGDLRPVFDQAQETLSQASGTIAVLRPQTLGLIAATKVTMGNAAQASIAFNAALPEFIGIGRQFGQSSNRIANNVERATRPDKWWVTGLKIGAGGIGGFIGSRTR